MILSSAGFFFRFVICAVHERVGILGDHKLLVGRDHEDLNGALVLGDAGFGVAAVREVVLLLIDHDAEALKALTDTAPDMLTHLADACGEDDCVNASEERGIGADVLLDPMDLHRDSELCLLVAAVGRLMYIPPV